MWIQVSSDPVSYDKTIERFLKINVNVVLFVYTQVQVASGVVGGPPPYAQFP